MSTTPNSRVRGGKPLPFLSGGLPWLVLVAMATTQGACTSAARRGGAADADDAAQATADSAVLPGDGAGASDGMAEDVPLWDAEPADGADPTDAPVDDALPDSAVPDSVEPPDSDDPGDQVDGAAVEPDVASCTEAPCGPVWSTTCSGTTGYRVCGVDSEGCPAPSLFVSCAFGSSCADGACGGACVVPEVMLVVDRSSSMQGPVWDFTRATLIAWAEAYQGGIKLGVRAFPGDEGCAPGPTQAMALDNAGAFPAALVDPAVASSTPLAAAISDLIGHFGDPGQGEHVILLSDGSETCTTPEEVFEQARVLRSRGTTLHAIGLGFGYDELLLAEIAAQGGGSFHVAQSGEALAAALADLSTALIGCAQPAVGGVVLCDAGVCTPECDEGYNVCEEACVAADDPDHCGPGCTVCPGDPHGSPTCDGATCGVECTGGYHDCGGACVSHTDPAHCGPTCAPCPSEPHGSATCDGDACGILCHSGYHLCGGACVSDQSPDHCGASCTPCPSDPLGTATCDAAGCGIACTDTALLCGVACAPCPADAHGHGVCDGTACVLACETGYHLCDGACVSDTDAAHCGTSCAPCAAKPNATAGCDGTACTWQCDGSALFCGGECAPCPMAPNGHGVCSGSACVVGCDPGFHLCDGGCASNASVDSCGSGCAPCPQPVGGVATCDGQSCGFACDGGLTACGSACVPCPTDPHGAGVCAGDACILACESGYHACGGTGCRDDTSVDTCGQSCTPCPEAPAHAERTCVGGQCGVACLPGYHMCGGVCSSDLAVTSCGESCAPCPTAPNGTATCDGVTCQFACDAGYTSCVTGCCPWIVSTVEDAASALAGRPILEVGPSGQLVVAHTGASRARVAIQQSDGSWAVEDVKTGSNVGISAFAISPQGRMFAMTNKSGNTFFYRDWGSTAWTGSLGPITFASIQAVFAKSSTSVDMITVEGSDVTSRTWSGSGWSSQVTLHTLAAPPFFGSLTLAPDGSIRGGFYGPAVDANVVLYAERLSGIWSSESVVTAPLASASAATADAAGNPAMAVATGTQLDYYRRADGVWQPEPVRAEPVSVLSPYAAVAPGGTAHIVYSLSTVGLIHSAQNAIGWSREVVDPQPGAGLGSVLRILSDGRPVMAYEYHYTVGSSPHTQIRVAVPPP